MGACCPCRVQGMKTSDVEGQSIALLQQHTGYSGFVSLTTRFFCVNEVQCINGLYKVNGLHLYSTFFTHSALKALYVWLMSEARCKAPTCTSGANGGSVS